MTFVNHYSIVTGLLPEHHGIVNNSMWDPVTQREFEVGNTQEVDRSEWWEGEPIWVTAEKQRVKSATMFWVGSSAEIAGHRPTYWLPYDQSLPKEKRVEQVLKWLDLPEDQRPQLITLYFEDADSAGHRYGPDSPEVKEAIHGLDKAFGKLMEGLKARDLEKKTYVILLSDHGMARVERGRRINLKDYVKSDEARVVGKGALTLVWPKGKDEEVRILERTKKSFAHFKVFDKTQLAQRFQYSNHRRISPLVFLADQGWYLDYGLIPSLKPAVFGMHGYDNCLEDMQAVFLIRGSGVKKGEKVSEIRNIDVYALLAYLLEIRPAKNDGDLDRIKRTLKFNLGESHE
jgi:predicted AlkP superfamily pyrophosphatase or phosphodiesterase